MRELSVIMPAYNEGANVSRVVGAWTDELGRLGIDYAVTVYDDGSTDGTADEVRALAARQPRVRLAPHAHHGHGPTVTRGYREADGEWVFQVDSDGEMPPSAFEALWRDRERYDLLMGRRVNRTSSPVRRVVTWMARATVWGFFGGRIRDVNTPYRLIRRDVLTRLLARVPDTGFAPNMIMAGLAVRDGCRIAQYPVRVTPRTHGASSISSLRALRVSWRCFAEAAAVRLCDPCGHSSRGPCPDAATHD